MIISSCYQQNLKSQEKTEKGFIMLAISSPPPLFSTFGWPLEESISHEQEDYMNIYRKTTQTAESSFLQFPSLPQFEFESSTPSVPTYSSNDPTMVKKLNHNASERDRCKKINTLYSSLRSLLPSTNQMKKLSIPTTISRVVKYIPELQQEVETLIQKKEGLLSKMNKRQGEVEQHKDEQRKIEFRRSLSNVSVSRIGDDGEIVIQISTILKVQQQQHTSMLSEVLKNLQEDGLHVINVSSSESNFGGRVFYSIHLQMGGAQRVECELLTAKLLSFIV